MSDMNLTMRIGALVDDSFRRAFGAIGQQMGKLDERNQQFGQSFKTGTAQLVGFAAPLVASAKSAMEFETAMAEVNKTVNFANADGLPKLGEHLKQLSLEIPMTAKELAGITAGGGQLGIAEKDLLGYTETVAKMSVAFDMSATDAGDSMAKLANVYKIPIKEIDKVGDAINALSNSSPAKANEIVSTLGRVGGLAQQFGLTVNETTALSGAFIALGKPPEVAATAINSMMITLSDLNPKSKKQSKAFRQMGLDMGKFSQLVKTDGQQAIMTLLDSIEKIPQADRIGALAGLFGRENAPHIAALSGGIDTYTGQLKTLQAVDSSGKPQYIGSMAEEFAKMSGTSANQLNLFKNNLNVLAITLGDSLLPAINDTLTAITPMIQSFSKWAKANPELFGSIVKIVGGLLVAKAVIASIGYVVTGVIMPLMKLGGAIRTIGTILRVVGMAAMANPLGIAIALLATAAYLIYKNWTPIKAFFLGIWNSLKTFANSGVGNILRTIASFTPLGLFIRLWGVVKPYFSRLWLALKVKVVSGINIIKNVISNFKPLSFFVTAWTAVFGYFSGLAGKFRAYGSNIIQGLIGGVTAKLGVLKDKISSVASMMAGVFSGKLEINSPSRLFSRIAGSIPEGIGGGVMGNAHHALGAVDWLSNKIGNTKINAPQVSNSMAKRLSQTEYSNKVLGSNSISSGMSAGTIHFSPTINVSVGNGSADVSGQVQEGINASFAEFERMLEMVEANRARKAFA